MTDTTAQLAAARIREALEEYDACTNYEQEAKASRRLDSVANPEALRALLAERDEQRSVIAELLDQMHHFANADQRLWDESQRDPESFKSWVRSRAAHLLAKFTDPAALAALTNKD